MSIVRFPGAATWRRRAGCGWYVLGGPVHDCGWYDETETQGWGLNASCCVSFYHCRDFAEMTYTSPDPFCLVYEIDSTSQLTATSTLFGLREMDRVSVAAGSWEKTDLACASGGNPNDRA